MEQLHNGFTLELSDGAFPLSTDSIALADFTRLPRSASVLDLGSGCGTLGLMLCAQNPNCRITGIELDSRAHEMALHNAEVNGISSRFSSICADFNTITNILAPGSFHCCISNPPYFSGGPQSKATPIARREDHCTPEGLFQAAAWALRYGGDFFLVHKPERLAELCFQSAKHHLEPKRLCLLRHRTNGPVTLILLQCRKGGKPGLSWEEVSLYDAAEVPTDYYRRLYHL